MRLECCMLLFEIDSLKILYRYKMYFDQVYTPIAHSSL